MEPLFAVRMTHDEDMYYNQVLASKQSAPAEKPGKKNFLSRVDLSDVIFGLLAFFVCEKTKSVIITERKSRSNILHV